jgi:DNA-binding transcriptional MocR family regulator
MITNSASHALDLVVRTMLKAGDTVFVEDPGYFNLFGLLALQGIKLVGIPRLAGGPDVEVVEELLRYHQPKAFFINSVFHNPTATNLSQQVAYQLLQLANRHGFFIIEDDVYADFQTTPSARLAALDQFDRVIYIGGFSKTLSSSLRLGYMAGKSELIRHFVDVKVLTSLGGTRLSELVVASLLESGLYRKHLKHLARRMNDTLSDAIEQLIRCGWQVFDDPCGGTFIWASVPGIEKSEILAEGASQFNIAMSPGNIYRPNQEPTAWIRINAAHALEERAADYMMQMAEIGTQRRQ